MWTRACLGISTLLCLNALCARPVRAELQEVEAPIYRPPPDPVQRASPPAPLQTPLAYPPSLSSPRQPVRHEPRPRYGLIAAGASVLGVSYLITAGAAGLTQLVCTSVSCERSYWPLFIPVAGPFVEMQYFDRNDMRLLLAFDGLVQTAGLVLLIVGAAAKKQVPIRGSTSFTVLPGSLAGGAGLLAAGSF